MPNGTYTTPVMNGLSGSDEVASLKPIDDALMALVAAGGGVVAVPGSADINWATIGPTPARPANDTPFAGGRTFRFDDDLQDTAPIYFRINYGSGSTNVPAVFIQVGTAVNADGTLAGNVCTRKVLSAGVATNTPYTFILSIDPNFFGFAFFGNTGASGANMVAIVERMRNESGVETEEGCVLVSSGNGESSTSYIARIQPIPFVGVVPADAEARTHLSPVGGMAGLTSNATDIVMAPIMVPYNGKWRYITALVYKTADVADNSIFDLQHMGEVRQYIALGSKSGRQWQFSSTIGTLMSNILMRWPD